MYSVEVPKLRYGLNQDVFHIDRSFFEAFEYSAIQEGELRVDVEITKYETHLDAHFHFVGWISLECDRCLELYRHALDFRQQIIYSFDEDLEFDTDEVVLLDESVPVIHLAQDFYDFIHLEIPLRKVPAPQIHLCAPEVLELLNLNPDGSERAPIVTEEEEEDESDPRWQALRKLKDFEDLNS